MSALHFKSYILKLKRVKEIRWNNCYVLNVLKISLGHYIGTCDKTWKLGLILLLKFWMSTKPHEHVLIEICWRSHVTFLRVKLLTFKVKIIFAAQHCGEDWTWYVCKALACMCAELVQQEPCLSVHGILPARILEWDAIPFSTGSSWPRDRNRVSCSIKHLVRGK